MPNIVVNNLQVTIVYSNFAENFEYMTRDEFCNIMASTKMQVGVTTTDLAFDMRMQWSTLNRLEKGKTNFSVQKMLEYIKCLKANLLFFNGKKTFIIDNYADILKWMKKCRGTKVSQRNLADLIGCSYVNLANVELGKTVMSIDTLLKIAEIFNYNIEIKSTTANGE